MSRRSASYRILLGFVGLFLLAIPLWWLFGRSVVFGYLFGLLITTAYFLYLLIFMEGPQDPM